MSKCLGRIIGCEAKTSSWHLNGFPDVVTLGQQYNVGEKPTVILYTYCQYTVGGKKRGYREVYPFLAKPPPKMYIIK